MHEAESRGVVPLINLLNQAVFDASPRNAIRDHRIANRIQDNVRD
jgi:hypothetical protein